MKQPHDNSRYKHVSIVCYRWPVYTNIKFLVSDKHILGYENSKLTHHFTNTMYSFKESKMHPQNRKKKLWKNLHLYKRKILSYFQKSKFKKKV